MTCNPSAGQGWNGDHAGTKVVRAGSPSIIWRKKMHRYLLALGLAALPATAHAQDAKAVFIDANGQEAGTAVLTPTPSGVLIQIEATGLPQNQWVAFHIHETGSCDHNTGHESQEGISTLLTHRMASCRTAAPMPATCPTSGQTPKAQRGRRYSTHWSRWRRGRMRSRVGR